VRVDRKFTPHLNPPPQGGRKFIKTTPENPVLWAGMKGVSAKGRKNLSEMLKQVQHDNWVRLSSCVIPNLFRDLGFGFREFGF
jgi:hypothetical protein